MFILCNSYFLQIFFKQSNTNYLSSTKNSDFKINCNYLYKLKKIICIVPYPKQLPYTVAILLEKSLPL
jgi:hypothetical protein